MSDRIPEGWRFTSIAECCEILDSQRIPLNSEERSKRLGEYPYYGANGIQGYIDDFIFDGDAILVAEDGGNFDQYAERPIAQWVTGKYWVNNHAHILRAKENDLDKWIFYSLVHKNILKFINGGTRAKLNQSDLREIQIFLPPLPEQKKIASILTSVDEVIETTQKQIDKLQDLKKATMNELLTKGIGHAEFKDSELGRIPKSWEVKNIGEVCDVGTGKRDTKNKVKYGKYPFFVRSQTIENIDDYSFDGEAILTAGDGVGTGKVFHYINGKFDFHQRVYKLSDFSNIVKGKFLFYYFSNFFLSRVQQLSAKGSVDSVRMEMITEMSVPLPLISEQIEITDTLSSLDVNIELNLQKLSQTKSLKKSLMQDLLTGKVRVQVN